MKNSRNSKSGRQGSIFSQSNAANEILINNPSWSRWACHLRVFETSLFTLESEADINNLYRKSKRYFGKITTLTKTLNNL